MIEYLEVINNMTNTPNGKIAFAIILFFGFFLNWICELMFIIIDTCRDKLWDRYERRKKKIDN